MKNKILYILIIIVLLVMWQYFGSTNNDVRLLLSSPSLIIEYFFKNHIALLQATQTTLIEAVAGLFIATLFSFGIMILCFYSPKFMDFVLPVMIMSQVIPLIVLAPFFIMWLGVGLSSKIVMTILMCFFPIFISFAQGYKAISQNIKEMMQIYNADTWTRIREVYFPLAMPSIMAGLKVSATLAVIGAIVAEFNGAEVGLGKNLHLAAKRLLPELMMSSLLLSTLLGGLLFIFINLIEYKFGKWYKE
jgi:ABC-type nitrate/sulfonate/bicarbonate transport system permease component